MISTINCVCGICQDCLRHVCVCCQLYWGEGKQSKAKQSKAKQSKGKEEKRNTKGINRREGRRMESYSSQFHSPILKISVWLYFKETVSRHCAWTKSCTKITTATNRNVSLLGSQAVKLMPQQQIAGIGEDLQYFWQDFGHCGHKSKSAAFISVWLTSKTSIQTMQY